MPFVSRGAPLVLSAADQSWLNRLSQSRSESAARVERSDIAGYAQGRSVSAIAAAVHTNRPKVECMVAEALELELPARIELYLQEVNEEPVVFKWKYKLESLAEEAVAS